MPKYSLFLIPLLAAPAYAGISLSLLSGMSWSPASETPAPIPDTTTRISLAGGGLIGFHLSQDTLIESGAIFLSRKRYQDPVLTTYSVVSFPVELRQHLGPVSIAAGAYFLKFLGSISKESGGVTLSEESYEGQNLKTNETGATAAIGLDLGLSTGIAFLVEGRIDASFTNLIAVPIGSQSLKFIDYMTLIGLRFG